MIYSHWDSGDYPIFINPTFDELKKLAESRWDTVRICVEDDTLAIASGHGNTHQSVIEGVEKSLQIRRWHPETYILFREGHEFYFNLEDMGGGRKVKAKKVLRKYFSEQHEETLNDLLSLSDEHRLSY